MEYVFHAMINKFIGYYQVCNTDTGEPLFGVDLNFVCFIGPVKCNKGKDPTGNKLYFKLLWVILGC